MLVFGAFLFIPKWEKGNYMDKKNLHAVPGAVHDGGNGGDTNEGKPFENDKDFNMAEATADEKNGPGVELGK